MKNFKKFLKESESPFSIESPLSSGGASDDPNTRHISSAEQVDSSENAVFQYTEPYYLDVLAWWMTSENWRYDDPVTELLVRDWQWMARNWNRVPFVDEGGNLWTGKRMEYVRDVLAYIFTTVLCGPNGCSKGVNYPDDWPVQPPWSPPS